MSKLTSWLLQAADLARLSCVCKDPFFVAGHNSLWKPLLAAMPTGLKVPEDPEPGAYKALYCGHMRAEVG